MAEQDGRIAGGCRLNAHEGIGKFARKLDFCKPLPVNGPGAYCQWHALPATTRIEGQGNAVRGLGFNLDVAKPAP